MLKSKGKYIIFSFLPKQTKLLKLKSKNTSTGKAKVRKRFEPRLGYSVRTILTGQRKKGRKDRKRKEKKERKERIRKERRKERLEKLNFIS